MIHRHRTRFVHLAHAHAPGDESTEEMNAVVGRLQDNGFIKQEKDALKKYKKEVEELLLRWKLE